MLRLLGFPKAKPEGDHGCSYCLVSILSVQSGGAGGSRRVWQRAPGGRVAGGSKDSYPVHVWLRPSETQSKQTISWLMHMKKIRFFRTKCDENPACLTVPTLSYSAASKKLLNSTLMRKLTFVFKREEEKESRLLVPVQPAARGFY